MRNTVIGLAVVMCLGGLSALSAEDDKQPESYWMRKKLEYSQGILEGLSREDYSTVTRNARSMQALSQLEKWFRANTPEYRAQLKTFRAANEQLIRQSEEKNLDGAAFAYAQVTLSCVNCHRIVRVLAEK